MIYGPVIAASVGGYLLGAIPFGYLVARAYGVDIFEAGSGNPGATNVKRVLGAKPGYAVFALDFLKGAVATGWPLVPALFGPTGGDGLLPGLVGLVAALLGHSFSCFTRFRGGKGVATAAGGLVVLMPMACLAGAAVWFLTFLISRYVSLASILAAVAVPAASWALRNPLPLNIVATAIGVFVIVRHRANIRRLLDGTEHKFVRKS
ncbi:MAG: glycerol-3-phosphate 1-O-acyltransferase PlsY [Opitutaceae bacterium]|nr:glycerol-3-phosphate 1-O-acyltransferase PlsY [Opitutaceae bacterium]